MKHINADSFGADIPANLEQISEFLNAIIDEHEPLPDEHEEREWFDNLWERYWNGEIPDAPKPVTE